MTDAQCHVAVQTAKLLGKPVRFAVVGELAIRPHQPGELARAVGISVSLLSHHLRLLKLGRLVSMQRLGPTGTRYDLTDYGRKVYGKVKVLGDPEE